MLGRLAGTGLRTVAANARQPTAAAGFGIIALVVLTAALVPLSGYEVGLDVRPAMANLPPAPGHWLGTDHLGRDVLLRLCYACRAFVGPGAVACLAGALLGVPLGALAGFYGGVTEAMLRFVSTVLGSIPRFVFVLLVCSIYGKSMPVLAVAAGVAYAPTLAEAVGLQVQSLRSAEYIAANRAHGLPDWRILWVHLVAAASGALIARHLVLLFGYFVVLETTLAYLGQFGVQEPTPSWGNMLVFQWGRGAHPLTALAPALALWITVVATAWASEAFFTGERSGD